MTKHVSLEELNRALSGDGYRLSEGGGAFQISGTIFRSGKDAPGQEAYPVCLPWHKDQTTHDENYAYGRPVDGSHGRLDAARLSLTKKEEAT